MRRWKAGFWCGRIAEVVDHRHAVVDHRQPLAVAAERRSLQLEWRRFDGTDLAGPRGVAHVPHSTTPSPDVSRVR